MADSLSSLFPDSYAPWLEDRLQGSVRESLATCDQCAMVSPSGLTRDVGPFEPDLKCCTYFPFVPNFGLGMMLEARPEIARVRLASAKAHGLLLPLGLFASPERQARSEELGESAFGRSRELLCPFFDSAANGCSVWKFRPGVCTTYYCKSERDEAGFEFWADLETYLNHFEWALAREAAARAGLGEDEFEMSKAVMMSEEPGEERDYFLAAAWGEWRGKEENFFHLAAQKAREVSSADLEKLMDPEFLELERSLRARAK